MLMRDRRNDREPKELKELVESGKKYQKFAKLAQAMLKSLEPGKKRKQPGPKFVQAAWHGLAH